MSAFRASPAPLPSVGVDAGHQGRGKEWTEQELGLSVAVVRHTPKPTSEKMARIWGEGVVVKGWSRDRLAEAGAASRLRGVAETTLGCGTHLLLAEPESAFEQGLREVVRHHERGVRLRCDDSDHGEAVS